MKTVKINRHNWFNRVIFEDFYGSHVWTDLNFCSYCRKSAMLGIIGFIFLIGFCMLGFMSGYPIIKETAPILTIRHPIEAKIIATILGMILNVCLGMIVFGGTIKLGEWNNQRKYKKHQRKLAEERLAKINGEPEPTFLQLWWESFHSKVCFKIKVD